MNITNMYINFQKLVSAILDSFYMPIAASRGNEDELMFLLGNGPT